MVGCFSETLKTMQSSLYFMLNAWNSQRLVSTNFKILVTTGDNGWTGPQSRYINFLSTTSWYQ